MNHARDSSRRKLYFDIIGNVEAPLYGGTVMKCFRILSIINVGSKEGYHLVMKLIMWDLRDRPYDNIPESA